MLRSRNHAKRVVLSVLNPFQIFNLHIVVQFSCYYYYCKFKTTTTTKNKKKPLSRLQALFASCELIELLKRKEINLVKYWKMFFILNVSECMTGSCLF